MEYPTLGADRLGADGTDPIREIAPLCPRNTLKTSLYSNT